ncbi:hypothetical protein NKR23_g9320 [Pleurostoma richardsiae]|uniref:Uncharacterized protein n=1 Tax=Pleurostoma richardsiae TaxID=41990 RepID=A0AA38VN24_9PEZI|nr:hypothetical protein NKR23_g9320 [Pleurostoma richardsiae]
MVGSSNAVVKEKYRPVTSAGVSLPFEGATRYPVGGVSQPHTRIITSGQFLSGLDVALHGLLLRPSFEKLSVRETLGITVDQFLFLPYFAILLILRVIDQT